MTPLRQAPNQNEIQSTAKSSADLHRATSNQQSPSLANRPKTTIPDADHSFPKSEKSLLLSNQSQSPIEIHEEFKNNREVNVSHRNMAYQSFDNQPQKTSDQRRNQNSTTNASKQSEGLADRSAYINNEATTLFQQGMMYESGEGVDRDLSKVAKYFHKAAAQGHANAQCNLGVAYERGEGVEKDLSKAAKWYQKAAEQGLPEAQFNLGVFYERGLGVGKDLNKAADWYLKAAGQGLADAQYILGKRYERGKGVDQDVSKAVGWYQKAAMQGIAKAQFNLGWMYHHGKGIDKDINEAVKWYRMAAEQGVGKAQFCLGVIYDKEKYVSQNLSEAVVWYRKAAAQGLAHAQYNLACMFKSGEGVDIDLSEAVKWHRKAAEQGFAKSQFKLGLMYECGQGVDKDLSKAVEWYKKAAVQGYAKAQLNLGSMYKYGKGVNQNLINTVKWYLKAAEQGFANAQVNLGLMYEYGEYFTQDFNEAAKWYRKAAVQGNAIAQFNLGSMYKHGLGVDKDLSKATYWLLRSGLSKDALSITIACDYFDVFPLIPNVLKFHEDFKKVVSLEFSKLPDQVKGQMGKIFAELIWSNIHITRLIASDYKLCDEEAIFIKQALDLNINLKEIDFDLGSLDKAANFFEKIKLKTKKKLPKIFGPNISVKSQLLATTQQNKDISDLRNYLENYLHSMEKPPRRMFDEMPSDIVKILAENVITTSLKKGLSENATKAALDEFLLSLQKNNLAEKKV